MPPSQLREWAKTAWNSVQITATITKLTAQCRTWCVVARQVGQRQFARRGIDPDIEDQERGRDRDDAVEEAADPLLGDPRAACGGRAGRMQTVRAVGHVSFAPINDFDRAVRPVNASTRYWSC